MNICQNQIAKQGQDNQSINGQIKSSIIEEYEDYDQMYDSYFISNVCNEKQNINSLLNDNSEGQFEEQQLFDIFKNNLRINGSTSGQKTRKQSIQSYIDEQGSSLNEEQETSQTAEKENFLDDEKSSCQQIQQKHADFNFLKQDLENAFQNKIDSLKSSNIDKQNTSKSHRNQIKTKEQYHFLESNFIKHQRWTKERIREISLQTGLAFSQIYKWNWDRRMALKLYHEQDKYCDSRYIKIFEVKKCLMRKQVVSQERDHQNIGDFNDQYKIFNTRKI
ncbi:UNKNOWN [Stylonychia lemnae]|uniref:Homeobox domain-containing protein n=1 Tax=Stylonychia lemnae TaxID=5949 RepID=A0A078B6S6_STYLE|nr:UNKNOWN [Stylonychia lemnae]|eukprot:CDW90084.1 UNKNOWN [Stylonychia lemnae]